MENLYFPQDQRNSPSGQGNGEGRKYVYRRDGWGKRGSRRGNLGGSKVEGAESDGKCVQTWC